MFLAEGIEGVEGTDPHGGPVTAGLVDGLDEQLLGTLLDRVLLSGRCGVAGMREVVGRDAFGLGEPVSGVFEVVCGNLGG
ncbi:hypothetical protein [Phytomonospora endophytica]|uniref:Uncharacterized protein n=1 Tax=Phytomonospora endophytica TaxID=714109 RepID=A0A841G014_9ACTN|nr:hypothetical protein [Phytomonospora endophytica]MBB6038029.1 hypothetical protein [Phytomonospora endophytica]